MTIREDLEKFNDDVKQHVQSAETDHEERVIQADERIIEVENKRKWLMKPNWLKTKHLMKKAV